MPGSISPVIGVTGQPVAVELSESIRTRYSVVAALAITQVKRTKHGARARMKRVIVFSLSVVGDRSSAEADDTSFLSHRRKKESNSRITNGDISLCEYWICPISQGNFHPVRWHSPR